jgi:hypothetical protein
MPYVPGLRQFSGLKAHALQQGAAASVNEQEALIYLFKYSFAFHRFIP